MKIIASKGNLSTIIHYTQIQFPDGQVLPKISNSLAFQTDEIVTIHTRLLWSDLQGVIALTHALRQLGAKDIQLYVTYFVGARSDRKFEVGQCHYLRDVICPIVNSLNFSKVTVLDPHSYVLEACLNNFEKEDNSKLISFVMSNMFSVFTDCIIITPDEGASKKIFPLMKKLNLTNEVVICSKDRDPKTGEILGVTVPGVVDFRGKDLLIIDDICDGGRTFIELAKKLKHFNPGNIYLAITHGIFSKGFDELNLYFDKIFTTTSYSDSTFNTNLSSLII